MKLLRLIIFILFPFTLSAQIKLAGKGEANTYTITNNVDDKSLKAVGVTMYVGNPFYEYVTATDGDTNPDISDYPIAQLDNTNLTDITDFTIADSLKYALILLVFMSDSTTIDNDSADIECHVDLSFKSGDIAWAFWNGPEAVWYVWPLFLKDD
jgi:hypothetical protein